MAVLIDGTEAQGLYVQDGSELMQVAGAGGGNDEIWLVDVYSSAILDENNKYSQEKAIIKKNPYGSYTLSFLTTVLKAQYISALYFLLPAALREYTSARIGGKSDTEFYMMRYYNNQASFSDAIQNNVSKIYEDSTAGAKFLRVPFNNMWVVADYVINVIGVFSLI